MKKTILQIQKRCLIKSSSIDAVVKNFRELFITKKYLEVNKQLDNEIDYFYNIPKVEYSKKMLSIVNKLILK